LQKALFETLKAQKLSPFKIFAFSLQKRNEKKLIKKFALKYNLKTKKKKMKIILKRKFSP
jgi:hypothetical protein